MSKAFRKKATITILAFVLAGALFLAIPSLFAVAQVADGSSLGASGENAGGSSLEASGEDAGDPALGESHGAEEGPAVPPLGLSFSIMPFSTNVTVTSFAQLQALVLASPDEYIVTVTNDFAFTDVIVVPSGMTIRMQGTTNITLTADTKRHFQVFGELEINDRITLNGGGTAGGIDVMANGAFTLNGAMITNCNAYQGGGIYVNMGAAFTFSGGTISNCVAAGYGGGIAIAPTAAFTMLQGTITGCVAHTGGGIAFASSTAFTMSQGTISGCDAHFGGGIYIQNSSTSVAFNLAGNALITDCKAIYEPGAPEADYPHGAGVFVGQGTFRMTGNSQIKDCVSARHGGGIYATSDSVIEIGSGSDSPKISGCLANVKLDFDTGPSGAGNGGGIHTDGDIIINSGSIMDCHAVNTGGGIFSSAVLDMHGGTIDSCTAGNAGGVFINGGSNTFNMYGGRIRDCEAAFLGGGVYVYDGKFSMTGSPSAVPVIDNCSAGSALVDYWAGQGGGVYVAGNGEIAMNGATIQNCKAYVNSGDGMGTYGSGGGIYLGESATGHIEDSTISGCTAMYHGGGIFTKDYNNLTTTADVFFSNNIASFYRIPADNIVSNPSIYPCTSAGSISPAAADLRWRIYPLNNYDINYLSYSVIYIGNGGTDGSETQYELFYEYTPFTNSDSAGGHDVTHTVFANDRSSNGLFEFTNATWQFSMWSNLANHVPMPYFEEYGPTTINPTRSLNSYALLSPSAPSMTFYALWKKDLIVKKEVIGAYGDLTKQFAISITIRDAWWSSATTQTVSLKHGQSQTLTVYADYVVSIAEDSGSAGNYTVEYYDGTNVLSSFEYVTFGNDPIYDTPPAITITVQNSRSSPVPTLVSSGNEAGLIAVIGLSGLLGGFAASYYRRKKRG